MKRQLLITSSLMFGAMLFSLMTGLALAEKKHWFVVKDKAGVCRVIEADAIAGPFKSLEEAEERKAKDCAKSAGQGTEQPRSSQEQAEPARRRDHQREDADQRHLKQPQAPRSSQEQAEPARGRHQQREDAQQQHLKQPQAPQHEQQTDKLKEKVQEKVDGAKSSEDKGKEKTKEPIPSDRKN